MNKKYGGLVSNPRNTKDTQVVKSITYTTNGTVVETVNLNAWPAATESNTPSPTQNGAYRRTTGVSQYPFIAVNSEGKVLVDSGNRVWYSSYNTPNKYDRDGASNEFITQIINEFGSVTVQTSSYGPDVTVTVDGKTYTYSSTSKYFSPSLEEYPE